MQAPPQLAHHLLNDAIALLANPWLYWPIIAAVLGIVTRWLRKSRQLARKRAVARAVRGWLTVPAVIDVVSVSEHLDSDGKKFYLAALTYFYRRTDLEMGEYQREFEQEAVARNWVKQFKGRQVMVHLNPIDVAESILLDSDLEGLEAHQALIVEVPAPLIQSLTPLDSPLSLQPRYRFLCALGELLSIAGLAGSGVMLAVSVASGGLKCPHWLLWSGGVMLTIAFLSMEVVRYQFRGNESAKSILQHYRPWYTSWMRWSREATAAALSLLPVINRYRADLPAALQLWMAKLDTHLPYIFGFLGFLLCASFYSAVERSQEQVQIPVSGG